MQTDIHIEVVSPYHISTDQSE